MADLSDVSNALVAAVSGLLYPNGTSSASAVGVDVRVYAGWPNAEQLDADLQAATPVCHVSVYPRPDERNTTRYQPDWRTVSVNAATLTLTAAGQTVTVGGTVPAASNPHVVAVVVGAKAYPYAVQPTDTLASIAFALAALVVADVPGTSAAGAVVTLPGSARLLAARVGVTGTAAREIRRQERLMQIAIWADSPAHRDAIAKGIDGPLAITTFLTLADGTAGRLTYKSSAISDQLQRDRLYRRDLFYTVEYGTTQTETETQITETVVNTSAAAAGVTPYLPVSSTTF